MKRSLFVTHLGLWLLTASTAVAGKPAPRQLTAKEALRLAISMPPAGTFELAEEGQGPHRLRPADLLAQTPLY